MQSNLYSESYFSGSNFNKSIDEASMGKIDMGNFKPPRSVKRKLDKLPNNQGYIFDEIWYFGKQPIEYDNDYSGIYTLEMRDFITNEVMFTQKCF